MPNLLQACSIPSPLGELHCASIETAAERGICLVEFRGETSALPWLEGHFGAAGERLDRPHGLLAQLADELHRYFAGELQHFGIPLAMPGTDFQRRVWAELLRIPYGATVSYSHLAERLGDRLATRAVGAANGANRIAILIPCHRVVAAAGGLGGYAGGLARKQNLLTLEGARAAQGEFWGAGPGTTMPAGRTARPVGVES